ncbi:MAG: TonB-dependent receptor [Burkholderiaceae bacterium]
MSDRLVVCRPPCADFRRAWSPRVGLLTLSVAAALSAGWPMTGAAQSVTALRPIVVTATRTAQPVVNQISDVESLSSSVLRDRGLYDLSGALGGLSGIDLSSNGGPGATSTVLLRGASAGQTLTLVDGFRLSSVSLGQPTYEALPLMLTDRIEVLRGPASGLYGADAIGGVVQLFTPEIKPGTQIEAEAAFGGESTRRLAGALSGGNNSLLGSIRLSRESSDGFNATRPGYFGFNADADGYQRDGIVANLVVRPSARTEWRGVFLQNELDADYDDGAFAGAKVLSRVQVTGLTGETEMDDGTLLTLRLGRTTDRSESVSSFAGVYDSTQDQFSLRGTKVVSPGVEMQLGYEVLHQDLEASTYAPTVAPTRKVNSWLFSIGGREGAHIVQLTARRDDSDQYGTETHGSFSYGYALTHAWRVGGSWASGFRAPGFNDLYYPNYGRPGITPEKAKSLELGLYLDSRTRDKDGARAQGWHGKAVLYRNRVRDLIVYAADCPDPAPQFAFGCAANVNRATIQGLGLSLGNRDGALGWRINADFADPQDDTLGLRLPRRATRQLSVALDYDWRQFTFGADLKLVGSRYDDAGNARRLAGYALLNLSAQLKLAKSWRAFASVINAADRDYSTAAGFVPQGRLVMVGVRYNLR